MPTVVHLSALDLELLQKLRLAVARFGEMDGACWWNTKGMLGSPGRSIISRGFPKTHLFAQARIACSVAAARCDAVFAPPGCLTLWKLPAEIEDQLAAAWPTWCREPDPWLPFFDDLATRDAGDLVTNLQELDLIDADTVSAVTPLKRSAERKSVPLPGTGMPEPSTLKLLAAAFSKGEKLKLAVPYIRSDF